jgi:hypothetical protein
MTLSRVCLVPYARHVGGPASFQGKFAAGLERRGVQVCYSLDDLPYDAVLVVGGTRQLGKLRRARQQGIPVVQRLNGMNWLHRKLPTGVRHYPFPGDLQRRRSSRVHARRPPRAPP